MNKQEKAKKLRKQGLKYWEIGQQIGVSDTMARKYVLDIGHQRPTGRENAPHICRKKRAGRKAIYCQRRGDHEGMHLGNDKKKLVYWE